jgi:hypothetical protein
MICSIFPNFVLINDTFQLINIAILLYIIILLLKRTLTYMWTLYNNINRFCIFSIISPGLLSSQFTQNIREKSRMAGYRAYFFESWKKLWSLSFSFNLHTYLRPDYGHIIQTPGKLARILSGWMTLLYFVFS